ncbi:putative extracellular gdsl-like lipase [Phaeomoniella chlamydospora]|uniref:Putative extracellular gdsl-like lipase n=1 Tax=Phaeomoniella chlamydospora TaxID=158046 RepID=A0A0G2EYH9_PHACM|nr:putative extracellular gdsl-like lipase [Phaeomoniella chlamydospora]
MSIGGDTIRISFSNAFGMYDLPITGATIALPSNGSSEDPAINVSTLQTLTFEGSKNITVPESALVVSDPIDFPIEPQSEITVTMYLADGQQSNDITSHPGSRATSYISFGDYTHATNMSDPSTQSVTHCWPDLLLRRLQNFSSTSHIAILNQAAGGNRILYDGLGPNTLSRLDRDIFSHPGISYSLLFSGINDIGSTSTSTSAQTSLLTRLITSYSQIIHRHHLLGIPIFWATLTPFSAPNYNTTIQPYSSPIRERTRQDLNHWIRNSGKFDLVVDFDPVLRNESVPWQLKEELQSGDYLHPNVKGYELLAESFPVDELEIWGKDRKVVNGFE